MATNNDKIKALSEEQSIKLLGLETFRARVNEIICEYIGQVEFMKKIREYAGLEIDSRIFTSWKYWGTLVITAVITSAIGIGLTLFFNR